MSTQVNTYVMYGVMLSYDELALKHDDPFDLVEPYIDNAFKPEVNLKDDITVLFDGMNGDYVAIGHVIAKTENHQHLTKPVKVPAAIPSHVFASVSQLVASLGIEDAGALHWHVISHYR